MDIEIFLNILGNETRREILHMLTERQCYVSEISEELQIGQKAIIEHLHIMESAGILEAHYQKVEKGRPRKYFHVTQNIVMEVNLFSGRFDVKLHAPEMDQQTLKDFPRINDLSKFLGDALLGAGTSKINNLDIVRTELMNERNRLTEAKKVIDFMLNETTDELEEAITTEKLKKVVL